MNETLRSSNESHTSPPPPPGAPAARQTREAGEEVSPADGPQEGAHREGGGETGQGER